MTSSSEPIIAAARDVLRHVPDVALAVLFGSWARGNAHEHSDVDIAVVWSEVPSLQRELALQGEFERAIGRTVDLVSIATAAPPLRWRIVRDGVLIFARDPKAWTRLRIQIAIEHDDYRETHGRALERQRQRLMAGGAR